MAAGDILEMITIAEVAVNNSEGNYTVPIDAAFIMLQSSTLNTQLRTVASGSTSFILPTASGTIADASPFRLDGDIVRGRKLYFFNAGSATIRILVAHLKQQ